MLRGRPPADATAVAEGARIATLLGAPLVSAPRRGAVSRLLLGSVTSRLAGNAHCDVLVARARPGASREEAVARLDVDGATLPAVDEGGRLVGLLGMREVLGALPPAPSTRGTGRPVLIHGDPAPAAHSGPVARLALGSVSRRLVHGAPCPTLIVRP